MSTPAEALAQVRESADTRKLAAFNAILSWLKPLPARDRESILKSLAVFFEAGGR